MWLSLTLQYTRLGMYSKPNHCICLPLIGRRCSPFRSFCLKWSLSTFLTTSVPSVIPFLPPVLTTHNVFTTTLLMPPVKRHCGTHWIAPETPCILPFRYILSLWSRSAGSHGAPSSSGFGSGWSGYQPAFPAEHFKIGLGMLTGFFGKTLLLAHTYLWWTVMNWW